MYTECPSCNTVFKISSGQLRAAAGKVRCGHCGTVFNALATLVDQLPSEAPPAPTLSSTAQPAEDLDRTYTPPRATVSETFDNLALAEARRPAEEPIQSVAESFELAPDDGLKELEDLFRQDATGAAVASETSVFGEVAAARTDFDDGFAAVLPDDTRTARMQRSMADDDVPRDSLRAVTPEVEANGDVRNERATGADPLTDYVLEEVESKPQPRSLHWVGTLLWGSAIAVLVMVLAGQFVYFKRAELAHNPRLKPWLEDMCAVLGQYVPCEIPPPRDLTALKLKERDVRSDPDTPDALLIKATMVNDAPFPQPFPTMRLSFSDINQQVVAERRFSPAEYLSRDIDVAAGMQTSVPVRVVLKIADPGEQAVNFEFNFE